MKKNSFASAWLLSGLLCANSLFAQHALKGKVTGNLGAAVPFAVIALNNTQLSTVADAEGAYIFPDLNPGKYALTVKSLGYLQKTDSVEITGDRNFDITLENSNKQLDEVVVNATRVDKNTGMAFNNVDAETLKKQNLGQDAPFLLNELPNVVVNSDAGNGVGYTGLRIRGSDGTRINVTINGVPVNDAESQGTFWVNMPDLASNVNNIQVQRGVGASSNGAGAFGATINFQTNQLNEKPYAMGSLSGGSYNTQRKTIAAGTGLKNNKFTFDARASQISSDGYIDRARTSLYSYYLTGAYYGDKTVIRFINFRGKETTYQAWNLVPEDSIKAGNRTYNEIGAYTDANGRVRYYNNETDNYDQNNYQLHFIRQLGAKLSFNLTGHYTKGKGYYEQYREDEAFEDYGITPPSVTGIDSLPVSSTDLIRRRWLDNDFSGLIFNLNYTPLSKLNFVLGGGYNTYYGKHFGRVIWAQYAGNAEMNHQYYSNAANKNDGNIYLKTNYRPLGGLNVFVDLQMRHVDYRFRGFDNFLNEVMQQQTYLFFNPKLGLSYDVNQRVNVYASYAVANKEPNRDDFVQSTPQSRPRPEHLDDIEAGVKYAGKKISAAVNLYNMQYRDQLVLNGQLNDVGAYNRVNVASSFRRGVEFEINARLSKYFSVGGNLSLSQNKIADFTEYVDSIYTYVDEDQNEQDGYKQFAIQHKNTDISFSPNRVASLVLAFTPVKDLEIALISKHIGEQYLDNTMNSSRRIAAYDVLNLRINYTLRTRLISQIDLSLMVNNLSNVNYETNGYTFGWYYNGSRETYNYLAPAAPRNFLAGITFKF